MAKKPQILREIQNKELPKVNYAYQKTISYSQMSMYRSCPHKWALQYKEGLYDNTPSIHFTFGTAMHEVIQDWLTVLYEESGAKADQINLEEQFQEKFISLYQEEYKKNNNTHYSSPEELGEFFEDGVAILDWFKKKRSRYFNKKGTYLVGCEVPIVIAPNKMFSNVLYMGYLDVVTYNERTDTFKIIDIKTSTKGWNSYAKKDENKQFQLLLYKQFFSEQYNIPLDKIEIEFFIVKRKVLSWDDSNIMSPHQAYRVQTFTPPSGKIKLNKAKTAINEFIKECFNSNGNIKEKNYPATPSKWNCTFCPFKEEQELCGEGIIY